MAVSQSSYSVGDRVYRGTSSAPNLGTVDPMGYIDRALTNARSNRSGLAQAALRRMEGTVPNSSSVSQPGGSRSPSPATESSSLLASAPIGEAIPPVPTVQQSVKSRMRPDGTYLVSVPQLKQQVTQMADMAAAAQRMLNQMQPPPPVGAPNGA
jgi:hypothetical protein